MSKLKTTSPPSPARSEVFLESLGIWTNADGSPEHDRPDGRKADDSHGRAPTPSKPGWLSHRFPRIAYGLWRLRVVSAPPEYHGLRLYLDSLSPKLIKENQGPTSPIPLLAAKLGTGRPKGSIYNDPGGAPQSAHTVKRMIRLLAGTAAGGEGMSAALAEVSPNSRIVRDVVRTLYSTSDPLVLLGEPGSGKSVARRQVGIQILRARAKIMEVKQRRMEIVFVPDPFEQA